MTLTVCVLCAAGGALLGGAAGWAAANRLRTALDAAGHAAALADVDGAGIEDLARAVHSPAARRQAAIARGRVVVLYDQAGEPYDHPTPTRTGRAARRSPGRAR